MACTFTTEELRLPVTSLCFYDNFLLSGEGNAVTVYDVETHDKIFSCEVFSSSIVHGTRLCSDSDKQSRTICVFGSKNLRVFKFSQESQSQLVAVSPERELEDWIWDVQWLTDETDESTDGGGKLLALALGHNSVALYNWEKDVVTEHVRCQEICILYSARLIGNCWEDLILAAGTVFNQVILWGVKGEQDSEGKVIPFQRLAKHQGVIFNMTFSPAKRMLCSVSDDRSINLWSVFLPDSVTQQWPLSDWTRAEFSLLHVLYGHGARVWDSRLLTDKLLSVGEDATCIVWDYNGNVLSKFKGHKGKSVWSIAVNDDESLLATGGGDTSLRLWRLSVEEENKQSTSSRSVSPVFADCQDFIRITRLLNSGVLLFMSNEGELVSYNLDTDTCQALLSDKRYRSYSVVEVLHEKSLIAVGNITGEIFIIDKSSGKKSEFKVHEGKIFGINWIIGIQGKPRLLETGPDGRMTLWLLECSEDGLVLTQTCTFELPHTKQWWSSAAITINDSSDDGNHGNTDDLLVCGDRGGTLHVYTCSSQNPRPLQSFARIHGSSGITCLLYHGNHVYSGGRDGHYRKYSVENNKLELLTANRVYKGLEWITKLLMHGSDLIVLGFHSNNFMMYNTESNQQMLVVSCGGGHRAWDFNISDEAGTLAYIKQKHVIVATSPIKQNQVILRPSIHGRAIKDVKLVFSPDETADPSDPESVERHVVLATCGEDTVLYLHHITETSPPGGSSDFSHTLLGPVEGHLSSVHCLAVVDSGDKSSKILFSGGGRAQLKAWKITYSNVTESSHNSPSTSEHVTYEMYGGIILFEKSSKSRKPWKVHHYDPSPETRFLGLAAFTVVHPDTGSRAILLGCACSDGFVRLFEFDQKSGAFGLLAESDYHDHCVLTVEHLEMKDPSDPEGRKSSHFLLSGATDGRVVFWDVSAVLSNRGNDDAGRSANLSTTVDGGGDASPTPPGERGFTPVYELQAHQSGINSLDVTLTTGDELVVSSGGDDGTLQVASMKFSSDNRQFKLISHFARHRAHAAPITGISLISEDCVITASVDQRVTLWKITRKDEGLHVNPVISKFVNVADVSALQTFRTSLTESNCVVTGIGMQTIKLK